MDSEMASLRPLIAICGTTGVGKSKLAVELALRLSQNHSANKEHISAWTGARIINADSMQVYAGLDIITNKIPVNEQKGIEHVLMGFKKPGEQYVVGEWVKDALREIEETHRKNQLPIVVGGTSYWIQHLLFPNRLSKDPDSDSPASSRPSSPSMPTLEVSHVSATTSPSLLDAVSSLPPELMILWANLPSASPSATSDPDAAYTLHTLLAALDPPVASRWHWRDTRKVLRSLEIIRDSGRKVSEIIEEQSKDFPKPRYDTLCFWLYADPDELNPRLDKRVDDMVQQGLLEEIMEMRNIAKPSSPSALPSQLDGGHSPRSEHRKEFDYSLGIYQSIGFREFDAYFNSFPSASSLPPSKDVPSSTEQVHAFENALGEMKHSTRKYAKRQVSWIKNKLLPAIFATAQDVMPAHDPDGVEANGPESVAQMRAYLLDANDVGEKWTTAVLDTASNIVYAFLKQNHDALPDPSSLSDAACSLLNVATKPTDPSSVLSARQKRVCETCTTDPSRPVMIEANDEEWGKHVKTKVHKRLASKAKGWLSGKEKWEAEKARLNAERRLNGPRGNSDDGEVCSEPTV